MFPYPPPLRGRSTGDGVINKVVVSRKMDDRLYSYLVRHSREPAVLRDLREETGREMGVGARMQISPEQGAFMGWLVGTLRARRAIEVGVFTGYSSISVARALPADGRLLALDMDARSMEMAKRYWEAAGVADRVTPRLGPAADTLRALLEDPGEEGSYDFAFVDADKSGYATYYELLLRLVRRGGVIAFDNVLWSGKVADDSADDNATRALRALNAALLVDDRVEFSIVPIGDGMALCTKK